MTAFLLLAIGAGVVYLITSEAENSKTSLSATNSLVQNNTCNSLDQYEVFPQQNLPQINSPFFGRTKELEELKQLILTNSARVININGPPAFGKSKLANQLGQELLNHTDMIPNIRYINTVTTEKSFFLCSSNTPSKTIESTSTSTTTDIEATDSSDKNVYGDDLCTWMAWQKQRTVLIFDNCDQILHSEDRERFINLLQEFLSIKVRLYNIIVVSQEQLLFLEDGFHSITLGAFSAEESQTLLNHYVSNLTIEQANKIFTVVGGCPLALKVVAQLLKNGKRGGLNNLESFIDNLRSNITLQLTNAITVEQDKLHRVIDIAYTRYLNKESRRCSRVLSLFPGSVNENMVRGVLSNMDKIKELCFEDVINLSFLDEFLIGQTRAFSFHTIIHDYLNSVNKVAPDVKAFNSSFLKYYSQFLIKKMKQIYIRQNISDEDKYKLNELEYHNMCEFVHIFLSTEMDEEFMALQTGTALGYLIHENLIPDKYVHQVFQKAYKLYNAFSSAFNSLCKHSSDEICSDIFLRSYYNSGCYIKLNSDYKCPILY